MNDGEYFYEYLLIEYVLVLKYVEFNIKVGFLVFVLFVERFFDNLDGNKMFDFDF